jgi:predicted deacylase
MRKVIEQTASTAVASRPGRSLSKFAAPLEQIAAESPNLVSGHRRIKDGDDSSWLLRYHLIGPKGGDTPTRIGIFAGIHGDKPEGSYSIVRFVRLLESHPDLARGYALSLYPICNPTGFEDNTRLSRRGKDLNREFWNHSVQPEILVLQKELSSHSFDGIISLHTADTNLGFYGIVRGADLTEALINPALAAAEEFLPLDPRPIIDGAASHAGIVRESAPNILSAPPKARPRPFEIILEAPSAAPVFLKECAFAAALQAILVEYRNFLAYAVNL